jgi:hypothetical protein
MFFDMTLGGKRRRLTPEQHDRYEQQEEERYQELYAMYEKQDRDEWDMFLLPPDQYKPDGDSIHRRVMARMHGDWEDSHNI